MLTARHHMYADLKNYSMSMSRFKKNALTQMWEMCVYMYINIFNSSFEKNGQEMGFVQKYDKLIVYVRSIPIFRDSKKNQRP